MDNQTLENLLNGLSEFGFTFIRVKANDKRPEGNWKDPSNRISPDEVITRLDNGSNYGIVPPEGCFIIDFDTVEAYQRSIEQESSIEGSLTFRTPKGYHVIFKGFGVQQGSSHTCLGERVDVRVGGKGYVVGPGSTRDGSTYTYHSGDTILDAPPSLCRLLEKVDAKPASNARSRMPNPA